MHKFGLVLSGGGARGAYQAGVLKALIEISSSIGIRQPFPVISGVSAGAINAAHLAAHAQNLELGAEKLAKLWTNLTAERVFRTDAISAGKSGFRFLADATLGAFYKKKLARSFLDTAPLQRLLNEEIPFDQIAQNINNSNLRALAVTAMNYSNTNSVSFVQGHPDCPMWIRERRASERTTVTSDHVMGSSAIPLFFPPIKVGNDHFGDGCLRNAAPLSPAIHLGADRLIVISVRRPDSAVGAQTTHIDPSLARILGVILNALLLDATDIDMERMSRINNTIENVPENQRRALELRKVNFLWIRPSQDIGHLAADLFNRLPSVIRYLVGNLGSSREASELTSYLLFDPDFCGELVRLGYQDGLNQQAEVVRFLTTR